MVDAPRFTPYALRLMAYTVLARRYRSQSFDQLVGQEPIAQTLRNAIATNRVAHAYLFCGTRGVGKTSMARLFARALNAPQSLDDGLIPAGEDTSLWPPLDVQQRMAEAIMVGDDLNVVEIDGASNNSVDQARQLIANAGLSPTGQARYKIYIIDEVHMLSGAAFNALLKTMEEPPSHIKFILCTTESHKVPATIQSRCQRFDFRNIATTKIAAHLAQVVQQEDVTADEQVLWRLAGLGNGSMRDALTLLDRLLATGKSALTVQNFEQMFGLPDQQLVVQLVDAVADADVAEVLRRGAAILDCGISQDQLVEVLVEHFRHLMLICACGDECELVELSDEARRQAAEQAKHFDASALSYMIALCENSQRLSRSSSNPRALLDATLVRLSLAEKTADVSALLASGDAPGPAVMSRKKKISEAKDKSRPQVAIGSLGSRRDPVSDPRVMQQSSTAVAKAPDHGPGSQVTDASVMSSSDPDEIWTSLQQRLDDRPGLAWVNHLRLAYLDQGVGTVVPIPGHREVAGFATAQRLEQIAVELQSLLGRPIRLVLQASMAAESPSSPIQTDARREAMELPLVQAILDVFPDAVLTDVRKPKES